METIEFSVENLSKWARECEGVRNWMVKNFPDDVLERIFPVRQVVIVKNILTDVYKYAVYSNRPLGGCVGDRKVTSWRHSDGLYRLAEMYNLNRDDIYGAWANSLEQVERMLEEK